MYPVIDPLYEKLILSTPALLASANPLPEEK